MKQMCIDESAAEITGLKQLIGDLQLRNQTTLADNAALLKYANHQPQCLLWRESRSGCTCGFVALYTADHPGAALLAELEAARAVVETVKAVLVREQSQSAVTVALAAYDKAAQR